MKTIRNKLFGVVFAVNTVGLLLYLWWLAFGHQRILYSQDGVLFLFPCLPFFFVYIFLFRGHREPGEYHDDELD